MSRFTATSTLVAISLMFGAHAVMAQSLVTHAPPSDRSQSSVIDPNFKPVSGQTVDPNIKPMHGGIIDPNYRKADGSLIDPNNRKADGTLVDPNVSRAHGAGGGGGTGHVNAASERMGLVIEDRR